MPYVLWDTPCHQDITDPAGYFDNRQKGPSFIGAQRVSYTYDIPFDQLSGICMSFFLGQLTAIRTYRGSNVSKTVGMPGEGSTSVYFPIYSKEYITDIWVRYERGYEEGIRGLMIEVAVIVSSSR